MVFISKEEQWFALTLIGDLMMKNGYLPDYSKAGLVVYSGLLVAGFYKGSMRPHLLVVYLINILNFVLIWMTQEVYLMGWVTSMISAINAFLLVNLCSFSYINPTGPYGVGHRQKTLKGERTVHVSIFYPIENEAYKKNKMNNDCTSPLLLDGENDLKGLAIFNNSKSHWWFRDFGCYRLRAINDERLHEDFRKNNKKLTPVILSHGLICTRTSFISIVNYLVSYGCIVYGMTHTDGSANYYQDQTKDQPEDVYYEVYDPIKHKMTEGEFRQKQLDIRLKDIEQTLDLIKEEASHKIESIDLSKLVSLGQSMGGITAIEFARRFSNDVKICAVLDPWYFPGYKQILETDEYYIKQPIFVGISDTFHKSPFNSEYDYLMTNNKFYEETVKQSGSDKTYNVVIKNGDHMNQGDITLYYHQWYKWHGILPFGQDHEAKYIENIELICAFLDEHDFMPVKSNTTVKQVLQN